MTPSLATRFLLPLALVLAVILVYFPGLGGGFIFDDFPNIVTNEYIHATEVSLESLEKAANAYRPGIYGRPLATMWFAIDHAISGKDASAYKVSSLLVHLANSVLVYLLSLRLLALGSAGTRHRRWIALGIALAWAIHPLQISTVLYVVQRMETLAATFVLLSLLAYLRGRNRQIDGKSGWHWLSAAAALAAIGMLAKESAILTPGFALAIELTLLGFAAKSPSTQRRIKFAYALIVAAAALVFLLYIVPRHAAPETFSGRDFTMYERVLSQFRILPMHIGQSILPHPSLLTFYYDDFPKSTGWFSPWTTAAGAVFVGVLLWTAWRVRRFAPLVSFGILWFFVAHSLTSSVLNLELVFEHRNYLALLGLVIAFADLARRFPMKDGDSLKVAASFAVVLLFGALGAIRAANWGSPLLLATHLVAINPESERAANDLGTLYFSMADGNANSPFYGFGEREFQRAAQLPNASPLPENALILMAASTGQPVDPVWWERLTTKLSTRPLGPQERLALEGLLSQHAEGLPLDVDKLSTAFRAFLDRKSWPGYMYARYADFVLVNQGDRELARQMFERAVAANPEDRTLGLQIVANLVAEGHPELANAVLEKMQQPDPGSAAPSPTATNPALGETD